MPPDQRKRKRFGWLAITLAFVLGAVAAVIGGGVLLYLFAGPGTTLAASTATHPPAREGARSVRVGDCLGPGPSTAAVIDRTDVVDCDRTHRSEVAAVVTVPGSRRTPNGDDLDLFADDACIIAFEDYVGGSWDDSDLDFGFVVPSDAAFRAKDRTVFCLVDTGPARDGGSVRGTGR